MKYLKWNDFNNAVKIISEKILVITAKNEDEFVLYGEPRGGLCLSVAISHQTGLPMVAELCKAQGKSIIWIDDIIDSGTTYRHSLEKFGKDALYVCWIDRLGVSDVCAVLEQSSEWVVFPWENKLNAIQDKVEYEGKRDIL